MGVPPDPLPPLPWLLLLQRADVCAADSSHLLGCSHFADGRQIPARKCMNSHFKCLHSCYVPQSPQTGSCTHIMSYAWQDIVEDERSDKEETESEDEDDDHERRVKSKNCHVQNGHTPVNSNHWKRDWSDGELEMKPCAEWRRARTCGPQQKAKEQKCGISAVSCSNI